MAFSRVAALRSAVRGIRPSIARPQCFRQVVRRGYASGHGSTTQAGGDTLWAVGAIAVTIPSCWYLLSNSPDTEHGHGDHGDSHGKEHEEHEEESEEESKDEPEEESKDEGEDKKASTESEDKDSDKSEDSDSGDDEKKAADTPDTSDDEGDEKNTKKSIPDAKGGSKKRLESNNAVKQGEGDRSDKVNWEKAAPSKESKGQNSQDGKQEGLSNTDTKHSTDITNDPSKSKKSEGGPDTAKVKGTVDPKRPQV
ncbi:uncharacterized protein LY89DRAFT_694232 [Mollisia scopiformis]|uniref:Cylicin I n=1 Tax=Mollisia scopiformis TaxID=149040 RepID=A0A194XNJ0_MOLSC|nr:uncharacterized protein LY89DRAFT_694232 [Mollisia scopiformis]KUJ21728.1 hypothetical protein LY89DRAFT_694232 [Mollisia scopiformis]